MELNIVWLKYAKQLICGCCTAWSSVANSLQRSGWQYLKMVDLFIWHILKKHSIRQKFWKPLADAVCVYIRLRLVDFSAFCLLICVFGLYYVQHSFFLLLFLGVLCKLTWLVFVSYFVPYIFWFQCLSRRFLKEFSVRANTVLDGKLFQVFGPNDKLS